MGGQFERISTRAVPRIAAERGHRGHFGMDRADVGRVRQKKHLFIRLVHGEGGIRTLDTGFSPYNGLANRPVQPLGHLSSRTCGVAIVAVWGVLWGSWLKHLQLAERFGLCFGLG